MMPSSVKQKASSLDVSTKTSPSAGVNGIAVAQPKNRTGLPNALKNGVEALSGFSLDDVRVHTNSSKPAQLQALAYTQGTDIHIAPGQERHLAHEAWHVVQQKQGRVKPTLQMKGVSINDDTGLEHEADLMGAKIPQAEKTPPLQRETTIHTPVAQQKSMAHDKGCGCSSCASGKVAKTVQRKIKLDGQEALNNAATNLVLANVIEKDNTIPGTLNELRTAINGLINDNTDRTDFSTVLNDVRAQMVLIYKNAKNIANTMLRVRFPNKAFLDTDAPETLEKFARDEVLGNDEDTELGYLVHPEKGKILGAGLGAARLIQPHEISPDATKVDWSGGILSHSHPSGSPHTLPGDVTVAVERGAIESKVIARQFQFTVKIDQEKIKELKLNQLRFPLMEADATGQREWEAYAIREGYDGLKYDKNSPMNEQEKTVLADEFTTQVSSDPKQWTMVNDYAMQKFMGFERAKADFASQGLKFIGPSRDDFLKYREKFYTGNKKNKDSSMQKDKSLIRKQTTMIRRGSTIRMPPNNKN